MWGTSVWKAYYTASATPEEEVRFTTFLIQAFQIKCSLIGHQKRHSHLDIRIFPMRRRGRSSSRLSLWPSLDFLIMVVDLVKARTSIFECRGICLNSINLDSHISCKWNRIEYTKLSMLSLYDILYSVIPISMYLSWTIQPLRSAEIAVDVNHPLYKLDCDSCKQHSCSRVAPFSSHKIQHKYPDFSGCLVVLQIWKFADVDVDVDLHDESRAAIRWSYLRS